MCRMLRIVEVGSELGQNRDTIVLLTKCLSVMKCLGNTLAWDGVFLKVHGIFIAACCLNVAREKVLCCPVFCLYRLDTDTRFWMIIGK
jgi:hypothetical protein